MSVHSRKINEWNMAGFPTSGGFSQFSQNGTAMPSSYRYRLGFAQKRLRRPCENCENLGGGSGRDAKAAFSSTSYRGAALIFRRETSQ